MKIIKNYLAIILIFLTCNSYAVYHKLSDYQSGGRVVSVDVVGDYAYTAKYSGLVEVLNVADPEQPQLEGSIQLADYVPGVLGKIVISDTMAYIIGQANIHVVNITTPSAPFYVGGWNFSLAADIIIDGEIAYVAGQDDFRILDISNNQSPQLLSSINSQLSGICLNDSLIYGVHSTNSSNLQIINVADNQNPIVISNSLSFPLGQNSGIAYQDSHVYIVDSRSMWSIDVSNTVNPVVKDTLLIENNASEICVQENKAVINNGMSGIKVIDISDPTSLSPLGFYDNPSYSEQAIIENDIAYVANSYSGLQIIDVSDNTSPYLISHLQTTSRAKGMDMSGNYLYLANGMAGMDVINISDPSNPVNIGSYFNGIGSGDNVNIMGSKLCFCRAYPLPELLFIDISTPNNPVLLKQTSLCCNFMESLVPLFQTNSHLFVGAEDTLLIFDVSDFGNPAVLAKYPTSANITDVVVNGGIGYISIGEDGIEIINLENINAPQYMGSYNTSDYAHQIILQAETLVVADGKSGFSVVDVSNPTTPELISAILPNYNSNITVKPLFVDNQLIVVDKEWNEIFTYSASDFNNLQLISSYKMNAEICKLIYCSGVFLCSVNYYGMMIIGETAILSAEERETNNNDISNFIVSPNPFMDCANISFSLNEPTFINIEIFDQSGKKVNCLVSEFMDLGKHLVTWNGMDANKNIVPKGVYFVKVSSGSKTNVMKVVFM